MIFRIKIMDQHIELEDISVVDAIIKIMDSGLYIADNIELSIVGSINNSCYQNT